MSGPLSPESMARIAALHAWTASPVDGAEGLQRVLQVMSSDELVYTTVIFQAGEPAGRIAWAEYARRRGYFDFKLHVTQASPSQLKLVLEAESEPVHTSPSLGIKVPS